VSEQQVGCHGGTELVSRFRLVESANFEVSEHGLASIIAGG